uniref:Uncharacterized protein n=1 Tax=Angiostrongylus cantonensis TaxID=6313 RepID=A0A0K0CSP9_ANGCA
MPRLPHRKSQLEDSIKHNDAECRGSRTESRNWGTVLSTVVPNAAATAPKVAIVKHSGAECRGYRTESRNWRTVLSTVVPNAAAPAPKIAIVKHIDAEWCIIHERNGGMPCNHDLSIAIF